MAENGAVQDDLTLRQIVDGISALVAVLTPDGAVETVNRQVQEYFGKTLEELREWSSTNAVHPDDLPAVIAQWTRSIESGQPYDIELRQRGADGVYRWFHAQGLPVRDWGLEALNGAVSEPAWKTKPSWYLVSTEDRMIPPDAQRAMSKRAGATVIEVQGSHAVYVSQPQAVASIIETAAKGVALATK